MLKARRPLTTFYRGVLSAAALSLAATSALAAYRCGSPFSKVPSNSQQPLGASPALPVMAPVTVQQQQQQQKQQQREEQQQQQQQQEPWRVPPRPPPVVACTATYPARAAAFRQALLSVVGQVDRVYVYLNHYTSVPLWLQLLAPRVIAVLPSNSSVHDSSAPVRPMTLGVGAKFYCLQVGGARRLGLWGRSREGVGCQWRSRAQTSSCGHAC